MSVTDGQHCVVHLVCGVVAFSAKKQKSEKKVYRV